MHDSHIHLALNPLSQNYYRDIQEFLDAGGKKILTQSTDPYDYNETLDIYNQCKNSFPNTVDLAMGIHPTIFQEAMNNNLLNELDIYKYSKKIINIYTELVEKNIKDITAIGETGLDYFEMYTDNTYNKEKREQLKELQKNSFKAQIEIAKNNKLPMSIHSRELNGSTDCVEDTLRILAQKGNGLIRGSFHSYTGDISKVQGILDMGFYIGFNAIITYPSGESVREILRIVPLDRILFETDGPFLPVQSERKDKKAEKRYGRPISIKEIIKIASEVKDIPEDKLEEITDNNYTELFSKE